MGTEALALIVSFTAFAVLLFLLGRLMVTFLKIALVAAVLWFVLSKIAVYQEHLPSPVKNRTKTTAARVL
jgi:hypothetical protein